MNKLNVKGLIFRYFLLVILGLDNLWIIYSIATPVTLKTSRFFLNIFSKSFIINNTIYSQDFIISIIPACIAGAAYYFLFILNLSTPMQIKTRIKSLFFLIGVFFIVNILRIVFFTFLYSKYIGFANSLHEITWYFGSTLLLVIIWFINVKIFKIKEIPIYSDFIALKKAIHPKKR